MTTRREIVKGLTVAGVAGGLGFRTAPASAEQPPETTRLRLIKAPSICWAPQYIAEDLLRAEGFNEITYFDLPVGPVSPALGAGQADLSMNFIGPNIVRWEAGDPVVFLGGVHTGCFELFGGDRVQKIRDLKGKVVAVSSMGSAGQVFISAIAAYVGLDPRTDITWIERPAAESMKLLAEGKIDGFIGFPPQPQEMRAKKIGHVILNSATDRPW